MVSLSSVRVEVITPQNWNDLGVLALLAERLAFGTDGLVFGLVARVSA